MRFDFLFKKQDADLLYRHPMDVTEVVYFPSGASTFPRCPRCAATLEREYMNYCDRCGQKLDWKHFSKAKVCLL